MKRDDAQTGTGPVGAEADPKSPGPITERLAADYLELLKRSLTATVHQDVLPAGPPPAGRGENPRRGTRGAGLQI